MKKHNYGIIIGGVLIAAFFTVGWAPPTIPPSVIPAKAGIQKTLAQRTAKALNLSACQVINLTLPHPVEQALAENKELPAFTLTLPIRGQTCTLELSPHSVRSPNHYEVKAQQADGSWIIHDPGPVRTVRGMVVDGDGLPLPLGEGWGEGIPGAKVAGSVGADGFRGLVLMPDQSEVWIEPLVGRVPGAKQNDYVVYEGSAVKDRGFQCGMSQEPSSHKNKSQELPPAPLIGPVDDTLYCAEIAFDVDFEQSAFYNHDIDIILAGAEATTNMMNLQYEHQVHITHLITAVLVRTTEPDPYGPGGDLGPRLSQVRSEWVNNQSHIPRDVVMLFTGTQGFGLGVANIGSVCDPNRGYCVVRGLGISGMSAIDINAERHELGHTWNAIHCSTCAGHTMCPACQPAYGFSQESIDRIVAFRDAATCLDMCGTVETGSTPIPFFDDFESVVADPLKWLGIEGVTVSDLGLNEPSGSQSLHLTGNSEIRSALMDLTGNWGMEVRYHWQPGGLGIPPVSGDELILEYLSTNYDWIPINNHVGNGSSADTFQFSTSIHSGFLLENIAHDQFRIRIRTTTNIEQQGDWFVDDLEIIPIQYNPCPENCNDGSPGVVDIFDLLEVISAVNLGWTSCDVTPQFPDGSFGNGVVNIDDIVAVLNAWGPCPE